MRIFPPKTCLLAFLVDYAKFGDLLYPLGFAWIFLLVKMLVEKRLLRWLGSALGLKDRKRSLPPTNDVLEEAFK